MLAMAFTGSLHDPGQHAWQAYNFFHRVCFTSVDVEIGHSLAASYKNREWVLGGGSPVIFFNDDYGGVGGEELRFDAMRRCPWGEPLPRCANGHAESNQTVTTETKHRSSAKLRCRQCQAVQEVQKPKHITLMPSHFCRAPFPYP